MEGSMDATAPVTSSAVTEADLAPTVADMAATTDNAEATVADADATMADAPAAADVAPTASDVSSTAPDAPSTACDASSSAHAASTALDSGEAGSDEKLPSHVADSAVDLPDDVPVPPPPPSAMMPDTEIADDDELTRALEEELFRDEGEAAEAQAAADVAAPEVPDAAAKLPDVPAPPAEQEAEDIRYRRIHDTSFVDESRFIKDDKGNVIHKWKVDYATRGGGGRATCRDLECLHRAEQAGMKTIEKGALRICRRVCQEKDGEATMILLWYHARCIFNTFARSRKTTRVIETPEDLEGFESIAYEDQQQLRRIISGTEDVRAAKPFSSGGGMQKRPGAALEETVAAKRAKLLEERPMKKGERVWTFCKVRPKEAAGPGGMPAAISVKSPKPELGMLVEDIKDGRVVVQFESAEHEKERIDKLNDRRFKSTRAWLRYPRIFEGKKQMIPLEWVQVKRPPPRLCSCIKQQWGHEATCGDISCGRGTIRTVFGVAQ
eukprot:TRINITY_DN33739_c0_g1_i1.p1 TRINITY_DN33739_c0_g1~~TRINITY_DN33739_c0_g1_i1.p1  ORF type:complete len:495 (+),score=128.38 TRINITY_DN33739_c0_g1_i1:47-1531(+)